MKLQFKIDGLIVDQSAFYQSPEDFTNPPEGMQDRFLPGLSSVLLPWGRGL